MDRRGKRRAIGDTLAGVGVYYGPGDSRNLSEPLPYGEQMNNRAELWAFIQSLRRTSPPGEVASNYGLQLCGKRHRAVVISVASKGLEVKREADR